MQNKINNKWQWLKLIFLLLNILFPLRIAFAAGGIATDGTVGPAQTLSGANVTIPQNLGTTFGKNLFHSFNQFNVNNGQTVTFTENTPNALENVISRVTGGSASAINGTLRSTPGGHANLYLVNPSGIVFGKNAQINVPGAFHASTADEVRFQDGAKFSASLPTGSTLTAAAPASFGFLGTSSATNGLLRVDGAQLAVKPGQKMDMVGKNISVENGAKLSAPEGEVRLEAVGQRSMNILLNQPSETAHGALALTKSSTIDASGEGGGKIIVRGHDLSMDQNAKILAKTNGKKNGAGIDVRLTGNMTMKDGSLVQAGTTGNGASGKILVTAKNLQIDGQNTVTGISSEAGNSAAKKEHSTGRAGDIELRIANQLSLTRSGQINSSSFSTGKAGNVTVDTGQLWIDTKGIPKGNSVDPLSTGIITQAAKAWSGKGGNIDVTVQGDMDIKGGSRIDADSFGKQSSGEIRVTAKNLSIDGQTTFKGQKSYLPTFIDSNVGAGQRDEETGDAGKIVLDIKDQLSLFRGGVIRSSSFSKGNAGKITVNAGQLLIDGQGANLLKDNFERPLLTGIITSAMNSWSGEGGNIDVTVQGDMAIKGGGTISADTFGLQKAGDIRVKANNLQLDGQTTLLNKQTSYLLTDISSNTNLGRTPDDKAGKAGNIKVDIADRLKLIQGGRIISTAFGSGDAGSVTVKAGHLLIDTKGAVDNEGSSLQTAIYTQAAEAWSGKGGNIAVTVRGDMAMKGGGTISASTFGNHNAGDIHIMAKNLLIDGQASSSGQPLYPGTNIISETGESRATTGNAGNITLDIKDQLSLIRSGQIRSSTYNKGNAGKVTVNAGQLWIDTQGVLKDNSGNLLSTGIFNQAAEAWSGRGGDIAVTVRGDTIMKGGSTIDASTFGNHNAGDIHIMAKNLLIDGQASSNGQPLYPGTNIISSNGESRATIGNAGNITLDIKDQLSLIRSGEISSSSFNKGNAGKVTVNAGQLWIDTQGALTGFLTGILTRAEKDWSGRGGDIAVDVQGDMIMKSGGTIDAKSFSKRDAGNITVSANKLSLDQNSLISTESVSGNGGNITIQRGRLIQLINSGFKTSVSGPYGGSGGNITVNGEILVMETGLIQANTPVLGASGGKIDLQLSELIPSGGRESLIVGGDKPIDWKPYVFGSNVIQAAAPEGESGLIQSTAPQLDLSGILSNLGIPQFDTRAISQDYCSLGTGSSLIRQGKGGLPPRSRDSVQY